MTYFLQQALNALQLGSIYALIALGYTMVYGILSMINFAHGDHPRDPRAEHEHVAVREVDEPQDAIDHRVAQRDERIQAADGETVQKGLDQLGHVSTRTEKPPRRQERGEGKGL